MFAKFRNKQFHIVLENNHEANALLLRLKLDKRNYYSELLPSFSGGNFNEQISILEELVAQHSQCQLTEITFDVIAQDAAVELYTRLRSSQPPSIVAADESDYILKNNGEKDMLTYKPDGICNITHALMCLKKHAII